jgi:drug/metabolite transporter (DMT)-like permease
VHYWAQLLPPVMFFLGLEHTSAADTSLLANGETVFSILFALVIFKERMKPIGYLAVALILFGVLIVSTNLEFNSSILRLDSGNLLVIGSTILWGLDNNIGKIITQQIDVSRLIQLKALIGGFILLLLILIFGVPYSTYSNNFYNNSRCLWICYIALSIFTQHKENRGCKGIFHFITIRSFWVCVGRSISKGSNKCLPDNRSRNNVTWNTHHVYAREED